MLATKENVDIAAVNDQYRKAGAGFMITPGIMELPDVCGLIDEVRWFNEFDEDSDPYGEHDFGQLFWHANKVFWKIDYCDAGLEFFEDPNSPDCHRVLTVMLANEY